MHTLMLLWSLCVHAACITVILNRYNMKKNTSDRVSTRSPQLQALVNQSGKACTKPETVKLNEFVVFFPPRCSDMFKVFNQAE